MAAITAQDIPGFEKELWRLWKSVGERRDSTQFNTRLK